MSTHNTIRCDGCGREQKAHGCAWASVIAKVWEGQRSVTYELDTCEKCFAKPLSVLVDQRKQQG